MKLRGGDDLESGLQLAGIADPAPSFYFNA
jgi:hypothetical protein